MTTRGLILNNPMNLEETAIEWIGEIRPTADPDHFLAQFDTMPHGLHAGIENLVNKQRLHGLNTWAEIIPVYAPPATNDTAAYITAMCRMTGVAANDNLPLLTVAFLVKATKAIITQEQGSCPIDDAIIAAAAQVIIASDAMS